MIMASLLERWSLQPGADMYCRIHNSFPSAAVRGLRINAYMYVNAAQLLLCNLGGNYRVCDFPVRGTIAVAAPLREIRKKKKNVKCQEAWLITWLLPSHVIL